MRKSLFCLTQLAMVRFFFFFFLVCHFHAHTAVTRSVSYKSPRSSDVKLCVSPESVCQYCLRLNYKIKDADEKVTGE